MIDTNRRSALALGLMAAAPALSAASSDLAASYGPNEGEERAPMTGRTRSWPPRRRAAPGGRPCRAG